MAEKWRRCDTCRKVLSVDEFEGDAMTCRGCVERAERPAARTAAATSSGPRAAVRRVAPVGIQGRGDREVRVRRARQRALEALAQAHPEEFEELHAAERAAEDL
ncbi:MAG: hypothetical protein ACTHOD_00070 [Motilibacteraceae bacterium]